MNSDNGVESARLMGHSNETSTVDLSLPAPQLRSRKAMNFCVVLLVIFVITIGLLVSSVPHYGPKRNVIIMISDGFGPASETYGRMYYRYINNLTTDYITPLDTILVGQSRTSSSSSLITDSAAGATAFSCAMKTYNGAVGVDPNQTPCGTVLEAAKREGFLTGLVATSRITHATPAAFSAHVPDRNMEAEIATHQLGFYPLGRTVDIMLGGGRCFFQPNTTEGSCRTDDRDLILEGEAAGWNFITNRQQFDDLKATPHHRIFPLAGLFAQDHMDYNIDRVELEQPSLKEMTQKVLDVLENATLQSRQGFFLMVEGSRIDMAAHSNDPVAHVSEILAYYEAVALVKEFVATHPDTIMISVSDHETGGFTIGRQITPTYPDYVWYPEYIANCKASSVNLARKVLAYPDPSHNLTKFEQFVRHDIIEGVMGMNLHEVTAEEVKSLMSNDFVEIADTASKMISERAQVGWTTHGHTAVDVNLYAHGTSIGPLFGNHENTDIGDFMKDYLDLDLKLITDKLKGWKLDKPLSSKSKNTAHKKHPYYGAEAEKYAHRQQHH